MTATSSTTGGPAGYRDHVATLAGFQKSRRGAPPYSLLVNRPAGRRIAALAAVAGLTPNAVSIVSAVFSAAGLVLMGVASPSVAAAVGVVALLLVGYAIDSADGQLARLTSGGTLAGEWLDHCLDMVKMSSFHAVILISAYRFERDDLGTWPMAVAVGFGIVAVTSFFVLILTDQLRRQVGGEGPPRPQSIWFMVANAPMDYGVQCLWLLTRPWPAVFFGGYALLGAANLGYLALGAWSRFGQLRRLDAERAAARAGATTGGAS